LEGSQQRSNTDALRGYQDAVEETKDAVEEMKSHGRDAAKTFRVVE